MKTELDLRKDLSENVSYNIPGFPVYIRRGVLSTYPNYSAIGHWHDDIELICVLSGAMQYNINGQLVWLREGDGIFINARQLHYGFSKTHGECIFICILMHPLLLCASPYVEQNYILPVLRNESLPYLCLHRGQPFEEEILKFMKEIYALSLTDACALKTPGLFFHIWENLFQRTAHLEPKSLPRSQHLSILKDMLRFIYGHYSEKITLDQISRAGKVGKTTCSSIFRKYTNEPPMSYLTGYRLKKGIELLLGTDRTISEICFEVGFSGASYFTEAFHKAYGCTPSEYRASHLPES